MRLIKGRAFVDSPRDYPEPPFEPRDCIETKDDEPYIPNGAEWRALERRVADGRVLCAIGIFLVAVDVIFAIIAIAPKH
jgi:hypothetical protein